MANFNENDRAVELLLSLSESETFWFDELLSNNAKDELIKILLYERNQRNNIRFCVFTETKEYLVGLLDQINKELEKSFVSDKTSLMKRLNDTQNIINAVVELHQKDREK
jgi:hypothetical protein